VSHSRITFDGSPENAMNSLRSTMLTSSWYSSPAPAAGPWCMSSATISQRPQKSYSTSPPDTPLVRRQSVQFLSRVMGRWSPATAEGHRPKQPTKVQRGAQKATRGGQSSDPNRSQLQLAVTLVTTTRRSTILMRSSLMSSSGTSCARYGSLSITSRIF
jgi:hypothetical protein